MHIVVVDSSRVILKIVSGLLTSHGHAVSCFTNSSEALAYLTRNEHAEVLITSLETQPISGFELCWSARLLADMHRPIYIIAMSSLRNQRNLAEVLDSGADDFIAKPPAPEELHARLRAAQRLTSMHRDLLRLAETDALTGLLNRRAFIERLRQALDRAREGEVFSFVMFDIDYFKSINDEYGHDVGDLALQAVAQEVRNESPCVGRIGGEEFGILYFKQPSSIACDFADRLRIRLSEMRIAAPVAPLHLTCSFGVSQWSEDDTISTLMKRADMALYEAKATGRNRVMAAHTDLMREPAYPSRYTGAGQRLSN